MKFTKHISANPRLHNNKDSQPIVYIVKRIFSFICGRTPKTYFLSTQFTEHLHLAVTNEIDIHLGRWEPFNEV